ncbi:MAG: (2Fe-2S)-binding protein [Ilumatobacteraceae bacterium]
MVVCSCHGVSERRIRREIDHGANSIDDIADRCQAGSCCLSCHSTIDDLLAERCAEATVVGRRGRRLVIA